MGTLVTNSIKLAPQTTIGIFGGGHIFVNDAIRPDLNSLSAAISEIPSNINNLLIHGSEVNVQDLNELSITGIDCMQIHNVNTKGLNNPLLFSDAKMISITASSENVSFFGDEELAINLGSTKNLKSLHISGGIFTGKGLAGNMFEALQYLNISSNSNFETNNLRYLESSINLETLIISNTNTINNNIMLIKSMFKNLKRLDISNTLVTPNIVDLLLTMNLTCLFLRNMPLFNSKAEELSAKQTTILGNFPF